MHPKAANLDADTYRGIRHHEEWFKKHGRHTQSIGFFDTGYEDENPGLDPATRALRKYANYADVLEAFLAFRPFEQPLPAQLEGKSPAQICEEWDSRREQTQAWERLMKARYRHLGELESPENEIEVETVGARRTGKLRTTFKHPERVARYRRELETAKRLYERVGASRLLPAERAEKDVEDARLSLASSKTAEERERNRAAYDRKVAAKADERIIDRWEAALVSREPIRAMLAALGPGRLDYQAADEAYSKWEAGWFGPKQRACIASDHPDPRHRVSYELRQWVLPLRFAYERPKDFFVETAPRMRPDDFDPNKIGPFENPFQAGTLGQTLRNWGFGALLNPSVRAAFDHASKYPWAFGEMLATAERKIRFPRTGSPKGQKRHRTSRLKPVAPRVKHWLKIFESRSYDGRRELLGENGIARGKRRLPTAEGCALLVTAAELHRSLSAVRGQWKREKRAAIK